MSISDEPHGKNARNPVWFFEQAKAKYRAARAVEALQDARQRETMLSLYHRASEMALKAALLKKNKWDGHTADYRKHDLSMLCKSLAPLSLAFAELRDFIVEPPVYVVPRVGEGACESSTEIAYADNVDWPAVPEGRFRRVAEKTLAGVASECGFEWP